ncbi:uncharacterized protein MELLADRAFT_109867 [Melampsora larici-populina 98AG31]|uniref:Uncharacterized protein n=1 Tax=Melampsora larici-populina (strain 98AG31 / pathotype 3-4-7) TaxID=747676 RepID=F4RXW4_MELLP|nr:uncharacterized protein MELLADRAFT_109867 [Melampsora larici-populina 98AG31]EGG02828.1 hypothetical protein MELLADRAFT_109867 [Melampsora larici-populina 98AG31]
MKVYLVLIVSVLNPYHKVNAGFAPPRDSESLLSTIDSLQGGSLGNPKTLDLIDRDEEEVKGSTQEVYDLSQPEINSRIPLATRLESTIKPSRNRISLSDTRVLANSCAPISTFPTRQAHPLIEGWSLTLVKNKTQIPKDVSHIKYVYKPKEILFRVNLNNLIGTGYWMKCYDAEVMINHQVLRMVAKRNRLDHLPHHHQLESYLKQSQLYFYACKVLIDFQQVIKTSNDFGKEDKALIAPLRFVENFVVIPDKGYDQIDNMKDIQDCWFFEEELIGEYLKSTY